MASGKSVKLAVTICWLRDDRADRKGKMMLMPWPLLLLCCVCAGCSGAQLRVNDERAEDAVREIKAAETIFKTKANRFATLRELVGAGLVGRALVDNMEFQHRFNIVAARDTYEAVAVPVDRDDQYAYVGWSFYVDESGIIRGSAYGKASGYVVAGKHDPPVRSQRR